MPKYLKILNRSVCFALMMGLFASAALAAATQKWVVRYDEENTTLRGAAQQTLVDGNDNVYMIGEYGNGIDDGILVAKYDTNGQKLWDKVLTGKIGYGWGPGRSAAIDPFNHVVITCRGGSIIKLDEAGNTLWEKNVSSDLGYATDLFVAATDPSGNVYAAGTAAGALADLDALIVKYSPDGALSWYRTYDGSGKDDSVTSLRLAADGTIYGGGSSSSGLLILRYDADGSSPVSITDPEEKMGGCIDIALDGTGNLVATGWGREGEWSNGQLFVAKFDQSGNRLWVTEGTGSGRAIRVDRNEDIYVAGSVNIDGTFYRYMIRKYSANGGLLWDRNYYLYGDSDVFAMELDNGMEPIITGEMGYCYDYVRTMKFSREGSILWDLYYRPQGFNDCGSVNYGLSLALDSSRSVYVAGYTLSSSIGYPYKPTLIKYTQDVPVAIDIKPGAFPNSIKLSTGGNVAVAILSSSTFDATRVDPTTVTLASAPVQLKGKGTLLASVEDVNMDGRLDMVALVSTQALQLSETDTEARVNGRTVDGVSFEGTDSVRVIP